jgi:hypothetical protein
MRRLIRWSRNLAVGAFLVPVTVVSVYGLQARRLPDLTIRRPASWLSLGE